MVILYTALGMMQMYCLRVGERNCLMVDEFDASLGTETTSSQGPSTNDTIVSMSGNDLSAAPGFYYEDYYYDSSLTASGDDYLDEHSGHDHDDIGYHYHLPTQFNTDNQIVTAFPNTIGPRFFGELTDDAITACGGLSGGGGPGGPPPGGAE